MSKVAPPVPPHESSPVSPLMAGVGSSPQVHGGDADGEREGRSITERLLESRSIQINGPIGPKVAKRTIDSLLLLEADDPNAMVTVFQNSPGGSVSDGFAIYDTMRFIKPEVRVINVGLCASIATVILLGASKEHRLSLPHTRYLIHQPLISGNVFGPASDLEITAQEILKTRAKINDMLAAETGQPLERVQRDTQRDYWMDAETAIDYGLIVRIITHRGELD